MPVPPGYHGCYLHVDLSTRSAVSIPISTDVLRRFVGGSGLGTWLLLEQAPEPSWDPLGASAPLAFVFSPLVGSPLTTSAKFAVVAKSPLTGRINDSLASSHFALNGKRTGHDALLITGSAEVPTTLVIEPDGVRFESAESLWGHSSREATAEIRDEFGKHLHVAAIGPAGERQVHFATISHDARHAGRGGLGAVMGAKQLKALAVHGDRQVEFADTARLVSLSRDLSARSFGPATAKYRELGTVSNLLTFNRLGALPTRNFQGGVFEGAEALAPDALAPDKERTRDSCAACTIGCEHIFPLEDSAAGVRMEYENLFALGPLCGVADPATVLKASARCDELGLDTISTGATVAFAMECVERGLIEIPGLGFGRGEALLEMIEDIAARRDWGELFSLGTRAAAEQIGGEARGFAPHVKGLELPGYEPRALQSMALGFAVGTRGADHNRSGAYEVDFSEDFDRFDSGPEVIEAVIRVENEAVVMDSLILCKFLRGVFEDRLAGMAELLEAVTGWDVTSGELVETAERIVTAKKSFNIRQGWTPAEDTLPQRFFQEPLPEGASRAAQLDEKRLADQVRRYNLARGWTEEGWVAGELPAETGLDKSP